jgi:CHASE3 domain sensor protein
MSCGCLHGGRSATRNNEEGSGKRKCELAFSSQFLSSLDFTVGAAPIRGVAQSQRVLTVGAGAALSVLALFGAVAFASVSRLSKEQRAIADANHTLAAVDQLLVASAEAERAGSEFLLTRAPAANEAFMEARSDAEESLDVLRASAEDRPSARAALDTLGPMIGERFASLSAGIVARRRGVPRTETTLARADSLRAARRMMLPLLNRIRDEELVVLAEKTRLMSKNGMISKVVILAGSILAFLLAAIAFVPRKTADGEQ